MGFDTVFDPHNWEAVPFHFWSLVFFAFGCIVGSFLNVCIYRMPLDLSVVSPPSHCPHCKNAIPFYLNVPLLTWLSLRGRCRNCGAPISPRYFIVELLTKAREDRLILAMIPPKRTLTQTVDEATTLMANPNTMMLKRISLADEALRAKPEIISKYACLFPKENLNVPVLDFDILREFTELCHKPVKCKNPKLNGQPCVAALQTIRFCLNENGAKLESEALGMFSSGAEPTHRDFTFNRPFLVMLMRKGSTKPYFAAWIANDELLVHEPDVPETTQPTTEKNK